MIDELALLIKEYRMGPYMKKDKTKN